MYCSSCGNKLADDAKFCSECGASVGTNWTGGIQTIQQQTKETAQKIAGNVGTAFDKLGLNPFQKTLTIMSAFAAFFFLLCFDLEPAFSVFLSIVTLLAGCVLCWAMAKKNVLLSTPAAAAFSIYVFRLLALDIKKLINISDYELDFGTAVSRLVFYAMAIILWRLVKNKSKNQMAESRVFLGASTLVSVYYLFYLFESSSYQNGLYCLGRVLFLSVFVALSYQSVFCGGCDASVKKEQP